MTDCRTITLDTDQMLLLAPGNGDRIFVFSVADGSAAQYDVSDDVWGELVPSATVQGKPVKINVVAIICAKD